MTQRIVSNALKNPRTKRILHAFSTPQTPRKVEKELHIKKLKLRPLTDAGLLKALNPEARKGKFYVLTPKAGAVFGVAVDDNHDIEEWKMFEEVEGSPKQDLAIMKTIDGIKRTSEEIRERASHLNPRMTRSSIKDRLNELVDEGLVETELIKERKKRKLRYYWISKKAMKLKERI